jgi:glyoxylase-like metal-dependent hydrolase (beta-lactamase superfamily II)
VFPSPGDLLLWLPTERVLLGGDVIYSHVYLQVEAASFD